MIVPVKKAKIFVLEGQQTDLLLALQKSNLLMVNNELKVQSTNSEEDSFINRSESVLKELSKHQTKKPLFETHTIEYQRFIEDDIKRYDLLEHLEAIIKEMADLKTLNDNTNNVITSLVPFKQMPYALSDLKKSLYVTFKVGFVLEDKLESMQEFFSDKKIEHELYELSDYGYPLIFVLDKDEEEELLETINAFFVEANLPNTNLKVKSEIEKLNELIANNNQRISSIKEELTNSKDAELELKILVDQLETKKERTSISFKKTESTVYIDGWIREDHIDDLRRVVNEVTTTNEIDIYDVSEEETPPTATNNNKFVHQFETITNMFSVPKHDEVDPNPVMSIWFWIIFGIAMGDIGYGLILVLGTGVYLKLAKPKGSMAQLLKVFFYSGFTSIAAGIFFGSLFGFSVPIMELFGLNSFDPVSTPMPMLYFSIAFGVFHIISGLILKMIGAFRQNDWATALADGLSWILILFGAVVAIAGYIAISNNILGIVGLVLVALGFILLFALRGRASKGVLGKILGSAGGVMDVINYASDLLSYSRILALTLSSAVIASTMNDLAALVQGNFIGVIFSILIYLVGHVFNLAMGLLSAYVHTSRLQYIEFFGKFYEGGGYVYEPLSLKTKYITEITL